MKTNWLFLMMIALLSVSLFFVACGDDDDDDDDNDDGDDDDDDDDDDVDMGDWWPPPDGFSATYDAYEWQGFDYQLDLTVIGADTFNGDPYTKVQLGDFTEDDIIGYYAWFDFSTVGQIGFVGSEIYWTNTAKSDTEPNGVFDLDDPVYIYINSTLDDPITDTGSGSWTIWGIPSTVDISLTSTTLDTNASVTVPYGTVDNCYKVQIDITEDFSEWDSFSETAIFYFHRDLGMVQLTGTMMMGFYLDLLSIN